MGLSADAHSIFRHAVDPRRVFCAGCAHSEFIHSDDGSRRCLYSECKCSAWRGPGERDDPITTIAPRCDSDRSPFGANRSPDTRSEASILRHQLAAGLIEVPRPTGRR